MVFGGERSDYKIISSYPRQVKELDGKVDKFKVMRVQHQTDGFTVSFLPSFVMPYKHYSTKVIGNALIKLYNHSYLTPYDYSQSEETTLCYQTLLDWKVSFENNVPNLLSPEAFVKLEIKNLVARTAEALMQYYAEGYCTKSDLEQEDTKIFRIIQEKLTCSEPLMGFFRPLLVPSR